MRTLKDEHAKMWEVHTYGAEVSGKADGPPPEGDRMIAFDHPSRADSKLQFTTEAPGGRPLADLTDEDLREILAIARDSEG